MVVVQYVRNAWTFPEKKLSNLLVVTLSRKGRQHDRKWWQLEPLSPSSVEDRLVGFAKGIFAGRPEVLRIGMDCADG